MNFNSHYTHLLSDLDETWYKRCRSWLRHCATGWKVVGSIPDNITGVSH